MPSNSAQGQFWVYVIEFDADWIVEKGKGTVYVGYTARTPQQRIESHRAGGQTAAAIFKSTRRRRATNLRLRQDVAEARPNHAGPWSTEREAMTHERKLSKLLASHGYVVEVGLGKPFGSGSRKKAKKKPRCGRQSPKPAAVTTELLPGPGDH